MSSLSLFRIIINFRGKAFKRKKNEGNYSCLNNELRYQSEKIKKLPILKNGDVSVRIDQGHRILVIEKLWCLRLIRKRTVWESGHILNTVLTCGLQAP